MIPGARTIIINNTTYYWNVKDGKNRYVGAQDSSFRLIVQHSKGGKCLTADLFSKEYQAGNEPGWKRRIALTPKDVHDAILFGLKYGWVPTEKGASFDLNAVNVKAKLEFKQYKLV